MKKKPAPEKRPIVRLDLPQKDHAAVRLAAARLGISMAEFARKAVVQFAAETNGGAK